MSKAMRIVRQSEAYKKAFTGASMFNPNNNNLILSELLQEALIIENKERKEEKIKNEEWKIFVEWLWRVK